MRLYKKLWKKLKAKLQSKSNFEVSSFDRAVIEEAYHLRQEYIRSQKFSDAVTNNLLEEESVDCFNFFKTHLKPHLSSQEWLELESLPLNEFISLFTKKQMSERLKNLENREQVSRAIKRIIQIEELKNEARNNLNSETYYSVILNLYVSKHVNGFMYLALKKMIKSSREKMYEIAKDTSLNVSEAQKKISIEVARLIKEEIEVFKQDLKKQKSPIIVGVEVDQKDIKQALVEFGKVPIMLKSDNLKKYIESLRR